MNTAPKHSMRLFGSPSLKQADGTAVVGRAAQRHRMALLTLLALASRSRLSRDKLIAWLWPDSSTDRGRNLLNVATYVIRSALGEGALLSEGDELSLNTELVRVDVAEFEEAIAHGVYERAVALHTAPLLDGFFLDAAPEFEQWVERERTRLVASHARALEALAEAAEAAGNYPGAVAWWRARTAGDPGDSRAACGLVRALQAAGNHAAALQHATTHARFLRSEFGVGPTAELTALVERLRREPIAAPGVEAHSPAPAAMPESEPPSDNPVPTAPAGDSIWVAESRSFPAHALAARLRRWPAAVAMIVVLMAAGGAWSFRGREPVAERAMAALPSGQLGGDTVEAPVGDGRVEPRTQPGTLDTEAYTLYRRGRFFWESRTREGHARAIEYFEQAIERDSNYADAYAALAYAYLTAHQMNVSELSEAETYTRIKWAAERALALDDRSADAHVAFAATLWCRHNWPGAERELRRAIALNPGDATARTSHALLLLGMGRLDEALAQIRLAAEIDPLAPVTSVNHGLLCYLSRDNACAIREYGRAAEVTPTWGVAHRGLGLAYAREGRIPEAIRSLRKAIELQPERHDFLADLAQVYALGGQRTEAMELLARATRNPLEPFSIARAYATLADADSAIVWLERSGWRWPHRANRADPALDALRDDPRFARLLARVEREMGLR